MKRKLVSVVIPTYNCDGLISDCLTSVKKQTYKPIEVIIVDSFSTDNTAKIAKKFGKVYSYGKDPRRKDIFAAPFQRNYGVTKAKGDYVYWIDSDMRLKPNVIQDCVTDIERHKADAIIVPEVSIGDSFWAECRALEKECYNSSVRSYTDAARFIKRSVWRKLGGLDASLGGMDDFDFQARLDKAAFLTIKSKSSIYHYEGKLSLRKQIIKKFIYGKTASGYFRKYRNHRLHLAKQYLRPEFFSHLDILSKRPIHTLGMVIMKIVENTAALTGLIYSALVKDEVKIYKS